MQIPGLKYLRTFQLAARYESFKLAANELCVTPSAVSHQIKTLEDALGLMLFQRGSHSLTLTDAGRAYGSKLEVVFSQLEKATSDIRTNYGRTMLRIQMPPFFASELFLPQLIEFQESHPEYNLSIESGLSINNVSAANVDIFIVLGSGPWPGYIAEPLFRQRYIAACSRDFLQKHGITSASEMEGKPVILLEGRMATWDKFAQDLSLPEIKPSTVLQFDSMTQVAQAAQKGLGIALLGWPACSAWFDSSQLVQLFDHQVVSDESFFLLHRENDHDRVEIQQCREWIMEKFLQPE